ncbi:MAG: DUF4395 domain-containing protein [Thermomicrobiales bacterium]
MSERQGSGEPAGPMVDVSALKANQVLIVALVAVAFALGVDFGGPWLVAAVAASLATGAALPGYGPFQLLYRHGLRPSGLVRPDPRPDDPAPHRFAQAVGGVFLLVSAIALFGGTTTLGWVVAWLVAALALVNLLFGFCAGCFAFYHLRRLWRSAGASA